jgi:hypothetical protein
VSRGRIRGCKSLRRDPEQREAGEELERVDAAGGLVADGGGDFFAAAFAQCYGGQGGAIVQKIARFRGSLVDVAGCICT